MLDFCLSKSSISVIKMRKYMLPCSIFSLSDGQQLRGIAATAGEILLCIKIF